MAYIPDEAIDRQYELSGSERGLFFLYCRYSNEIGEVTLSLDMIAEFLKIKKPQASKIRTSLLAHPGWIESRTTDNNTVKIVVGENRQQLRQRLLTKKTVSILETHEQKDFHFGNAKPEIVSKMEIPEPDYFQNGNADEEKISKMETEDFQNGNGAGQNRFQNGNKDFQNGNPPPHPPIRNYPANPALVNQHGGVAVGGARARAPDDPGGIADVSVRWAVVMYEKRFGHQPPVNGQDLIIEVVKNRDVWQNVLDIWKGNGHAQNLVGNLVDRYKREAKKTEEGGEDGASRFSGGAGISRADGSKKPTVPFAIERPPRQLK